MFTYSRKAHYHETDQMGVVHHANYPKWMEEARVAFLDEMGLSYRAMEEAGVGYSYMSVYEIVYACLSRLLGAETGGTGT